MVHPIIYAFLLLSKVSLSEAFSWPHRDHASLFPRQAQYQPSVNASGRVTFRGYDVSKPWPSSEDKTDNWSLSLQVGHDLDISFSNRTRVYTGAMVTFSGPEYVQRGKMDPSWSICQAVYLNAGFLNDTGKPIDPTCKGVLSDSCIAVLQRAGSDPGCETFARDKEECPELLTGIAAASLNDFNYKTLKNQTDLQRYDVQLLNPPNDMGNYTQYDQKIRQITVVLTSFNLNPHDDANYGMSPVQNNSHLSCLAVDHIEPNSRTFEASASTLSRVGVLSGFAAAVVLVLHSLV